MISNEIIKFASNTSNVGLTNKYTFKSTKKNSMCGDLIKVELIMKNSKINSKTAQKELLKRNIQTRPFFWPMHKQDIFKKEGLFKGIKLKNSEFISKNGFYLPSGIGLKNQEQDCIFKEKIAQLIDLSYQHKKINYNTIHFVSNSEAEMIKLFRNNFLSVKVSFCNEIAEFCSKKNIDYENVRKLAILDKRIGASHSFVPGHDGRRGYGGTCFPKDTNNLKHEMKQIGMKSYIIENTVSRNEEVDRAEKDWNDNKGRAVIE